MQKIILLTCLFLSANVILHAQNNCNCNGITRQQFDELVSTNDSAAVFATITGLKKNADKNCSVIAADLEITYRLTGKQLPLAFELIEQQEKLIASLSCKNELVIHSYINYASFYRAGQDYENLSKYAFKALENAEDRKDEKNELKAIAFIVHLFTRQNQNEKNWDYIKRAEKIILNPDSENATAVNLNWLAFEYEAKYSLAERITLMDSAMLFATKAKVLALQQNNFSELTRSFRIFESNAYNRNEFKKAITFADSSIFYIKKIKTGANPASLFFAKAWDYKNLKDYNEAQRWMDTCLTYAEKFEGRTPATMALYGEAAKLFEDAGNLPKAMATLKTYGKIKDSVFKLQRLEKINELEQKYNKAKNEKTIKELAQQKSIYLLLALAGLLAAVAIAFFLRQQQLKHKKNILETEQRLNRARMNPHFFFNALTTLQKFALRENDGQAMASNLSKFSNIMRETLESTYKEYVTIEQETDFLNEYLELQKIRFPQKFTYEINTDKKIEPDELLIPAMILQPFVENSIEHGFTGIDYAGHISISFDIEGNDLKIEILDNGKGLQVIAKEGTAHISRASQIITDRIYLLNMKLKSKAAYRIDDNKNEKGVTVSIKLPLLYKQDIKS